MSDGGESTVPARQQERGGTPSPRNMLSALLIALLFTCFLAQQFSSGVGSFTTFYMDELVGISEMPLDNFTAAPSPSSSSEGNKTPPPSSTFFKVPESIQRRAMKGKWVLDWDYARDHQYPVKSFTIPFVPTEKQPFRRATAYRWIDEEFSLEYVDRERVCRSLESLGVTGGIVFIGDSTMQALYQSFVSLMEIIPQRKQVSIELLCSSPSPRIIPIDFHRIDGDLRPDKVNRTKEVFQNVLEEAQVKHINDRLLLVVNIGIHVHEFFDKAIDLVLNLIEHQQSTRLTIKDLWIWKDTVPGHINCRPRVAPRNYNWTTPLQVEPFKDYAEYQRSIASRNLYNWNMIEGYNEQVQKEFQRRKIPIYYLNTFNMTILRRDGHIGGADCLHYFFPGPTDFQAHLLANTLYDLS